MQKAGFIEIFINNDANTPVYYDHLRVTHTTGPVMEVNTYYPYGMIIPDLSIPAWQDKKNYYKYNAKELQEELNLQWLDFGARMYDPVVGRWWQPDRYAEKYYHLSPYSYAANNPINVIDVNGDYIVIIFGETGIHVFGDTDDEEDLYDDPFFKSTVRALKQLKSGGKFGEYMISELQNSDLKYNISYGNKNKANHNYDDFRMEDGIMKTGANITWTGKQGDIVGGLGHELGHGWDAMNGYDIRQDKLNILPGDDAPSGEVRAVHMENLLRVERGMDLRTTYFRDDITGAPQGIPLVDAFGKDTRFGYDYRGGNIPYNFGNGYGVRLRGNPYIKTSPVQSFPQPNVTLPVLRRR